MRILVFGGTGFLGSYVTTQARQMNHIVIGAAIRSENPDVIHADISNIVHVQEAVHQVHPQCIINCAAMTNVDECEKWPEKARLVNAIGPTHLAKICHTEGIRLIQVSTDAVFDGELGDYSEDSITRPINQYARTKLEGEMAVASMARDYVIIRTNFYGLNRMGQGLLNWVLKMLTENREVNGFDDVIFNPLWVADLADCLIELAQISYDGILNCAGDQIMSKYEFAKRIAKSLGYDESLVKRSSLGEAATLNARRPRKTFLVNSKMHALLNNTKIHLIEEVMRDPAFDVHRHQKA